MDVVKTLRPGDSGSHRKSGCSKPLYTPIATILDPYKASTPHHRILQMTESNPAVAIRVHY